MKPDLYTKVVLTVIALSLAVLAIDRVWSPAEAQQGVVTNVNLVAIDGKPLKVVGVGAPPHLPGQLVVVIGKGSSSEEDVALQVRTSGS